MHISELYRKTRADHVVIVISTYKQSDLLRSLRVWMIKLDPAKLNFACS